MFTFHNYQNEGTAHVDCKRKQRWREVRGVLEVIKIDEGKVREHLEEVVRSRSRRRSTACLRRKPTSCAGRSVMSEASSGSTREPATI